MIFRRHLDRRVDLTLERAGRRGRSVPGQPPADRLQRGRRRRRDTMRGGRSRLDARRRRDDLMNGDSGGDFLFGDDGSDVIWGGRGNIDGYPR